MEHLLNDIIELIGNNMPDIRTVEGFLSPHLYRCPHRRSGDILGKHRRAVAKGTLHCQCPPLHRLLRRHPLQLRHHWEDSLQGGKKKRAAPAPARSLHRLRFSSHKDILKVLHCEPRDKGLRIFLYSRSDGIVPAGDYEERTQNQGVTSSGKRVS